MLVIAEACAEDAAAITDLWRAAGLTRPWNDPAADFARALAGPSSSVLVGKIDDQLIAAVMVGYDGHRGWLYYLAVQPALLRKGHGAAMVNAASDWLKKAGAPKAELMLRDGNPAAVFYETLGWTREPVTVWSSWIIQETE
jgi:GNAT superfamily N-acetyltransferase